MSARMVAYEYRCTTHCVLSAYTMHMYMIYKTTIYCGGTHAHIYIYIHIYALYTYTYVIYTYYTHIHSMFMWVDLYFTFAHTSTPKTSQKGILKTNSLFCRYFDLEIYRLGCIYVGCRWLSWLSNRVESHGTSAECVVMFHGTSANMYIIYIYTYIYIFFLIIHIYAVW